MTVNRFDAPLAQLEVELEKARVKRRLLREAGDTQMVHVSHIKTSDMELNKSVSPVRSHDGPPRKHPIQRAPSRLYRTVLPVQGNPRAKYCCPNTCIGPEFVVNSSSAVKHIRMTDIKHSSQIRRITVILLNGRKLKVSCNTNSMTTGQLFEVVMSSEAVEDNFTLGLAVLLGGDFVFPPADFRLSKVSPAGLWDECRRPHTATVSSLLEPFGGHPPLTMYVRTKFFLPTLRGIRSWNLKHQLYLQLRRCMLEQQLRCPSKIQLFVLMGYALQAEFGDFTEKEHGCGDYFLLEHYLPDSESIEETIARKELQLAHQERCGLDPGRAEEMFISLAQQFSEYGTHFYAASCAQKSGKDVPVWLAISAHGISLHEWRAGAVQRPIMHTYQWKDIRKLSYSRQQFCLQPSSGKRIKLRMDLRKSYFTFRLASMQHQFFLKYRAELSSLQSVAAEFGVPIRKNNLSYIESQEPQDVVPKPVQSDIKSVLGAVLGPAKSRQVVNLPSPPKSTCRFSQLASILGAAVASNSENIEEIQNKENELPTWASRPMHQRCGSYDSIGLLRDTRHDTRRMATSPQSNHASVSPASTISRTSVQTYYGVPSSENRTPSFPRRSGVRMGTRAYSLGNSCQTLAGTSEHYRTASTSGTPCGTRTPSECSAPSSPFAEAYVINSSIKSVEEHFQMDSHESISDSLAEKMGNVSFEEERVLRTIRLQRDRLGSLGIEITEGEDGGVYIQSVQRGGAAAKLGSIHRGDRLIAVDGHCLLNRRYEEALRFMRSSGEEVELVLSQATHVSSEENQPTDFHQNGLLRLAECNIKNTPVEETYLRDIRYRTEDCPTPQHIMMPKSLRQPEVAALPNPSKWTAHKKYPAPKPPHMRNVCCIAPVPEDCSDVLDCTI
ncbi:hypothetical protein FOCC_FOCC003460 [Frankliniella occidentalis]|uniref:Tyrosine-protein phosphatase non-receptor type 13-like n=1 Tax=Frankliniella occidentalis TaxID=133901 RepID=A0A6J1SNI8_FRAOC|nr:tyrosine-protein phosphatase non-receptor type 13-like [Frankliniella occidentalis]XP_052120806.1 tyrosine-protein phosphatase non-receptor type 13-like [Frankliniella occidentalis]KAE8749720.1 hypothetical protein FOCC_FOCC003460 [Frankliniella occidentalis]